MVTALIDSFSSFDIQNPNLSIHASMAIKNRRFIIDRYSHEHGEDKLKYAMVIAELSAVFNFIAERISKTKEYNTSYILQFAESSAVSMSNILRNSLGQMFDNDLASFIRVVGTNWIVSDLQSSDEEKFVRFFELYHADLMHIGNSLIRGIDKYKHIPIIEENE